MKKEKNRKFLMYAVFAVFFVILLSTVLTIRRSRRKAEVPSVSENNTAPVPHPEIQETPKLSEREIIDQIIGIRTGEVYSFHEEDLFSQLREYDERDAQVWKAILNYWDSANAGGFTNTYEILPLPTEEEAAENTGSETSTAADSADQTAAADASDPSKELPPAPLSIEEMLAQMENEDDPLPEDLPKDDSLCFVVLGFQLNPDGSIRQELVNRLTAAYLCAQQYPDAYVLTTGGPTASQDRSATEAEAMADYLVENGIDAGRLIVENASLTTYENAIYSCEILSTQYPQVEKIVVVSSDYHIPMGCLLFEAQSLIDTYEKEDRTELHVVGNVGCLTDGRYYFGVGSQASQLKSLSY